MLYPIDIGTKNSNNMVKWLGDHDRDKEFKL